MHLLTWFAFLRFYAGVSYVGWQNNTWFTFSIFFCHSTKESWLQAVLSQTCQDINAKIRIMTSPTSMMCRFFKNVLCQAWDEKILKLDCRTLKNQSGEESDSQAFAEKLKIWRGKRKQPI